MMQSESIKELATALAKAQGVMAGAKKDCTNPFFHSKYADLASMWDACRQPLSENGLSVVQTTHVDADRVYLLTQLFHNSGEWIQGKYPITPTKNDPQGMGSAITYARRYTLAAIVGIAPEDDDGNAASGKDADTKKVIPEPQKKQLPAIPPALPFEQAKKRMSELDNLPAMRNWWKKYEQSINLFTPQQQQELKVLGEQAKDNYKKTLNNATETIPVELGGAPDCLLKQARSNLMMDQLSFVEIASDTVALANLNDEVDKLFEQECIAELK